ncbi:MAG: HlyD family efflux transporter periplasmic adaptor subunit [Shimia sp.]
MTVPAPSLPTDVRRRLRLTAVVLLSSVAGLVAWSALAEITTTLQVPGTLESVSPVYDVQHETGGALRKVHVSMHDHVSAGDIVAALDTREAEARLSSDLALRALLEADLAEVEMRVTGRTEFRSTPDTARKHSAADEGIAARVSQLTSEIETLTITRAMLEDEYDLSTETLAILQARRTRLEDLAARSLATRADQEGADREWLAARANALQLRTQLAAVERDRMARTKDISIVESGRAAELREAMVTLRKELLTVDARIARLQLTVDRAVIRAPIEGVITALPYGTDTMVLAPGQTLATIAQPIVQYEVQVKIPPAYADQVHVGQAGRLMIPSLSQRETPPIPARLVDVAPEPVRDRDGITLYYEGKADVAAEDLADIAELMRPGTSLTAGQPISLALNGREMTLWRFLTKPFTGLMSRAFEE